MFALLPRKAMPVGGEWTVWRREKNTLCQNSLFDLRASNYIRIQGKKSIRFSAFSLNFGNNRSKRRILLSLPVWALLTSPLE